MTEKKKGAGGRPTKYKDEYVQQVEKLCRLGATDEQVADFFDVDVATVYRWKLAHDEFCEAIKSKAEVDALVEQSLLNTALAGNTTAQIFWLKNRKKDEWRDKQEIDHKSEDGTMTPAPFAFIDISDIKKED